MTMVFLTLDFPNVQGWTITGPSSFVQTGSLPYLPLHIVIEISVLVPTNAITSPSLDRATTITVDYSTQVSFATSSGPATLNVGAIAGGVAGGILGLGLVSGLFLYLSRRKQKPALQPPSNGEKQSYTNNDEAPVGATEEG
jgi:hypothetical protein